MKRYDLVVFDWDGTLVDSAAHIVASLQAASRDIGFDPPSDDASRHIIGLGLQDALDYLFPSISRADAGRLVDRYRHHYLAGESVVVLFDGVEAGLRALQSRGHFLAVATGKSRVGLERALDDTRLRACFDATRCGDEGFTKPHPGMLEYLLDRLGVAPGRALMVGDTTHDLEMAAGARVDAVAVTYGAHDPAKLAKAPSTVAVDTPQELWSWLHENA